MSDSNESLVRKIKGLLALSRDKSTTEAEAASAAAKVQSLLEKYNISLSELESETKDETGGGKRDKAAHDRSAMYNYQRDLMKAVAEANFCMAWIEEIRKMSNRKMRNVKQHVLLGRDVNVLATTLLYDYLIEAMDSRLPWQGMQKRGKEALAWLDGCTVSLVERLRVMAIERQQAEAARQEAARTATGARGTGIVLASVYDSEADFNNDALHGLEPGTTGRKKREAAARAAEYEAQKQKRYDDAIAMGATPREASIMSWGGRTLAEAREAIAEVDSRMEAIRKREQEAEERRRNRRENETPAQREARERREQREKEAEAKREADAQYRQRRRNAKFYDSAYVDGRETGREIGLDHQVATNERKKL